MHIGFTFLSVTLRRKLLQAICYISKVRLEVTLVCHFTCQLILIKFLECQVILLISIQKIGVYLVTHHLVRNNEPGVSLITAIYRYQTKIEE